MDHKMVLKLSPYGIGVTEKNLKFMGVTICNLNNFDLRCSQIHSQLFTQLEATGGRASSALWIRVHSSTHAKINI